MNIGTGLAFFGVSVMVGALGYVNCNSLTIVAVALIGFLAVSVTTLELNIKRG